MKRNKRFFTLLEVVIVIALLALSSSAIGWKMHGMIAKKRFSSNVEKLRSRLLACRQLSLNMQEDWEGRFTFEGKQWTLDVSCIDSPKEVKLPPISFSSLNLTWNGEKRERFSFTFTSSGDVVPKGLLRFENDKGNSMEWKFPDIFFSQEEAKLRRLG